MKPEIIIPYQPGVQNSDLKKANSRLTVSRSYKDLSTIILTPTRGGRSLCPHFVSAVAGMMRPMNQPCFGPVYLSGMEVGDAFNSGIEMIMDNPVLRKFKYILTLEDDNIPPPDGLIKLYEGMEKFDAVGGLYFTKGEAGMPMCYGNPNITPLNFVPQQVMENTLQHCNGLGMGFTMFRMEVFHKMPKPWFETKQTWDPGTGVRSYTQDLWAFEKMAKLGMRVACDTRVRVGHMDIDAGMVW